MTLTELQTLIGDLTGDPNHDRYTTSQINTELDNSQDMWNLRAGIIKDTATITVVDGTRRYALSNLTGTVLSIPRATHKGLPLSKRSKSWLDMYAADDWTDDTGTPTKFIVEAEDPDVQYITLHPTPTSSDAGAYLVVEYIKRHTSMSASSDVPFLSGTASNPELRPYDYGLAYDVSSRLLMRDVNPANIKSATEYKRIADESLADIVQVFKALEKEEPMRMKGGRYWGRV